MGEIYTTGIWRPKAGEEDQFVAAWSEFAQWAGEFRGAGTLRLARDLADPERYVSFGRWDSAEAAHAWKTSAEFRERMGRVQAHVAEFTPDELEIVASRGSD
jgi:heme-degrading monooxygenase HmoA